MTETKITMGSTIPEWLLSADPEQAGAPKGNWRFAVDVKIIETEDQFLVVPLQAGQTIMDNTGMVGHRIYATSKPVCFVNAMTFFFGLEVNAWQPQGPYQGGVEWGDKIAITREPSPLEKAMRRTQERMATDMLLGTPTSRPSYWRRLWRHMWSGIQGS